MLKLIKKLVLVLVLVFLSSASYAQVPHLINYQGRLTDKQSKPLEGSYKLTFRIYDDEASGTLLWEETHPTVVIQKGVFSILLGSVKDLGIPFDKQYFLEIKVGEEVLTPRQLIASSAYAIRAQTAEEAKTKADSLDTVPGYLSDKVDNFSIEVNALDKVQVKNCGITANKISAVLGSNSSKSVNTVYQATTDGFVVAYSSSFGGWGAIYGYTDLSNPPNTIIADNNGRPDEQSQNVFICFPVKKENYWKVLLNGNASSATVTWVPLGN